MDILQVDSFNLIGISVKTSNNDYDKLNADMGGLWNRFMSENIMGKIPGKISNDIYCLYTDYEGDYTLPYSAILGCRVENLDNIPDNLVGKFVSGGKYTKSVAKGNIFQGIVYDAWKKIWTMDTPRSYSTDFEVYGEKAQNPENAEVEIFVAIK